jgi:hypothetical protein
MRSTIPEDLHIWRHSRCKSEKEKVIAKSNTRKLAEKLEYDEYIRWGDGECNNSWASADETFDRCIEALIGAGYLGVEQNDGNGIVIVDKILIDMDFSLR